MSLRSLIGWWLVALGVVVLWAWLPHPSFQHQANLDGRLLFPSLAGEVNAIRSIRLVGAGKRTEVHLLREAEGWKLTGPDEPADAVRIRSWLLRLSSTRVLDIKTAQPSEYAAMGVQSIRQMGAGGTELILSGAHPPLRLIIGRYDLRQDGTFVRKVGTSQSLLVEGDLTPSRRAADWMSHPLLGLPAGEITQLQLAAPGGPEFALLRNAQGRISVTRAPPGVVRPRAQAALLISLFEVLDFREVRAPLRPPSQALSLRVELRDKLLIKSRIWRSKNATLAVFKVQNRSRNKVTQRRAALLAQQLQRHVWVLAGGIWPTLQGALYASSSNPASTTTRTAPAIPTTVSAPRLPALRRAIEPHARIQ